MNPKKSEQSRELLALSRTRIAEFIRCSGLQWTCTGLQDTLRLPTKTVRVAVGQLVRGGVLRRLDKVDKQTFYEYAGQP